MPELTGVSDMLSISFIVSLVGGFLIAIYQDCSDYESTIYPLRLEGPFIDFVGAQTYESSDLHLLPA